MRSAALGVGLTLFASVIGAPPSRRPHPGGTRAGSIAWVKDLATAQKLARAQKKLVMQFLMLGDLPDPHC
jgi:hypothetical protein